jgi:hypothetical protein
MDNMEMYLGEIGRIGTGGEVWERDKEPTGSMKCWEVLE